MENHLFTGWSEVVCDVITRGSEVKNCQAESWLVLGRLMIFSFLFFTGNLAENVLNFY